MSQSLAVSIRAANMYMKLLGQSTYLSTQGPSDFRHKLGNEELTLMTSHERQQEELSQQKCKTQGGATQSK